MPTHSPLASILVATYRGSYLADTLRSILASTVSDFEIIVLDDAADAACRDLVAGFGDSRLRYSPSPTNLGPALNHARGIAEARGNFIAIVNHDDLWTPDILEHFLEAFKANPMAVAAFSRPHVVNGEGTRDPDRTFAVWQQWDLGAIPVGLIDNWFTQVDSTRLAFPVVVTSLIRSEILKQITIPASVGGSYDFWIGWHVAESGPVVHDPEAIGYWREHQQNLTLHRSAKLSFQRVYLDAFAIIDFRLPLQRRLFAAKNLPRALASTVLDVFRGARTISRS